MRRYVIAPRVELVGVNAIHNEVCSGIVSPATLSGFAHALDLEMIGAGAPYGIEAAGIVVHRHSRRVGTPRLHPHGNSTDASMVEMPAVDASVTLVFRLRIEDEASIRDEEDIEALSLITDFATAGSLGGGRLFPSAISGRAAASRAYRLDEDEMLEALEAGDAGNILVDASSLLEAEGPKHPDPMTALLSLIGWSDGEKDGRRVRRQVADPLGVGALVPIAVGYAPIEPLRDRENAGRLPGALHAYAQTLTSLGRWVPVGRRSQAGFFDLSSCLWRYRTLPDGAAFVAVAD